MNDSKATTSWPEVVGILGVLGLLLAFVGWVFWVLVG